MNAEKIAKQAAKGSRKYKIAKEVPGWSWPLFENINPMKDTYRIALMYALNYANYVFDVSEIAKYAKTYAKKQLNIDIPSNVSDFDLYAKGKLAWVVDNGGAIEEDTMKELHEYFTNIGQVVKQATPKQKAQQDAKRFKSPKETVTNKLLAEMEGFIDDVLNKVPDAAKIGDILDAHKTANLNEVKDYFNTQLKDIVSGGEGYEGDYSAQINIIKYMLAALDKSSDTVKAIKKATTKKPKKINPIKMVSKLQYLKDFGNYKSVVPERIVGCDVLWVYNTKTRNLGKYVALNDSGLFVKGSTILGHDEEKSVYKKLRKPDDVLTKLLACGKIEQRKVLDSVKAVEQKLNGRINKDTILFKIY